MGILGVSVSFISNAISIETPLLLSSVYNRAFFRLISSPNSLGLTLYGMTEGYKNLFYQTAMNVAALKSWT